MPEQKRYTTGSAPLDRWVDRLAPGDNVVWRVDRWEEYLPYVAMLAAAGREAGRSITYFRFADHPPLLEPSADLRVVTLTPEEGFEGFITEIHREIRGAGDGDIYLFDALSGLTATRYSDRMIGNFFRLTCPYLRQKGALAYFGLYRHLHSHHAVGPVESTTQLLIDVYGNPGGDYLQLYKWERGGTANYSSRLFRSLPGEIRPVEESGEISRVLQSAHWEGLRSASYRMVGLWDRAFLKAESIARRVEQGELTDAARRDSFEHLLTLLAPRDRRMLDLARSYITLETLLWVWRRMVGTGMIGGKAMGMLVARGILEHRSPEIAGLLEPHDSFFVGSDVFYTYMVENDCWWQWQAQKESRDEPGADRSLRDQILSGTFPAYIVQRFSDLLAYYGDNPIILRSSSLLEDSYGNAFSGRYDSVFSVNQGSPQERLTAFLEAIRRIYAGAVGREALEYRRRRGVLHRDEQMAILVQRVSGKRRGRYFFPHMAGVGYSFNPYRWHPDIDPAAGVLRLVLGLGTRAVDRHDDDYTRIVALNTPALRPESGFSQVSEVAQRHADVLDLEANGITSIHTLDLELEPGPRSLLCRRDRREERRLAGGSMPGVARWVVTFEGVIENTTFVNTMRKTLSILRDAYATEVDVEFAVNFRDEGGYEINLLQCRTFQVARETRIEEQVDEQTETPEVDGTLLLESPGPLIGHGRVIQIDRLIYVSPEAYDELPDRERYAVARQIGALLRSFGREERLMLIGPGRWGTSTPSLGVPVSFAEIGGAEIICEIEAPQRGLTPDLSLGTHFFNDLVESNILYVASPRGSRLDGDAIAALADRWEGAVAVVTPSDRGVRLIASGSSREQRFRLVSV